MVRTLRLHSKPIPLHSKQLMQGRFPINMSYKGKRISQKLYYQILQTNPTTEKPMLYNFIDRTRNPCEYLTSFSTPQNTENNDGRRHSRYYFSI
jgi:hypothetical protein